MPLFMYVLTDSSFISYSKIFWVNYLSQILKFKVIFVTKKFFQVREHRVNKQIISICLSWWHCVALI